MSYGVSNETPWNSDAYDTKNAKILPKISIPLDPPTTGVRALSGPLPKNEKMGFRPKNPDFA